MARNIAIRELFNAKPRLMVLERKIEEGLAQFVEVGMALEEIRQHALYEEAGCRTFEEYCQKRWSFGESRARQLIVGARAVTSGNAEGARTEREAREMARRSRHNDLGSLAEWTGNAVQKTRVYDAADLPEGCRIAYVGQPYNDIRIDHHGILHVPQVPLELNEREKALLLARLEWYEGEVKKRLKAYRAVLRRRTTG